MKISNLQATLGDFTLDIDSVTLQEHRIHALIGSNGCGKSTIAKIIMGILPYQQGEIDFEGLKPHDIILASQKPYMLHDTVWENIVYPLKVRRQEICDEEVDRYLKEFGILAKKFEYARQLSSGQQQKVSLIRTIIAKPKFIIIDESLSNLDIESMSIAKNMLKRLHEEYGATFVLISHQVASIADMVNEYHFFDNGRHILSCDLAGLKQSNHEKIKYYMQLQSLL